MSEPGFDDKENSRAAAPLGEGVYRLLWERIVDRRLRPGQKLSDLRLSRELGVSRTPVREALHRLVSDGIVRIEPNRGFFIVSFSAQDIGDIYDLRAALEALALERSAATFTPRELADALARIEQVASEYAAATTDAARIAISLSFLEDVDRSFHRTIVQRANNSRLRAILDGLWAQIRVFQQAGSFRRDWFELSHGHHRAVINALIEGETPRAIALLREHILAVRQLVLDEINHDAHDARRRQRPTKRSASSSVTNTRPVPRKATG